jgi:hypothetical protein
MPFNISYGPISSALSLAQSAGMGQYKQRQFEDDTQALGLQNEMQRTANEKMAQTAQNALGYYEARSRNALAQAEMQRQANYQQQMMQYRNQNLNSLEGYRTSLENSRAANADVREQALKDKESQNQTTQDARTALGAAAATMLNATNGRSLPPGMTPQGQRNQQDQYNQAVNQLRNQLAMQRDAVGTKNKLGGWMPKDPNNRRAFDQVTSDMAHIGDGTPLDPLVKHGIIKPQVNPQMQHQTAAAASGGVAGQPPPAAMAPNYNGPPVGISPQQQAQTPRIVTTDRNPQDGKMWGYDAANGRWMPLEQ